MDKRKSIRSRVAAGMLTLLAVLFLCPVNTFATSARVSLSNASAYVGEEISVTCSVSEPVAAATIRLSYDATCLQFVKATGSNSTGGSGSVLLDTDISDTTKITYTVTFKALKASTSNIVVTSYDIVDGNGDEYAITCGSSEVTIRNHSSDATLKAMSVSSGRLYPTFSADTTTYSVTVANSVTSIAIQATVNNSEASVSVSSNRNSLSVGSNRVTVTVTAGDGSQKVYTVNVVREEAASTSTGSGTGSGSGSGSGSSDSKPAQDTESSEEEKTVAMVRLGETEQEILPFEDDVVPKGFKADVRTYEEQEIPVIVHEATGRLAVWLQGEDSDSEGFYWFDSEAGTAEAMQKLTTSRADLLLLDVPEETEIPEGYTAQELTLSFGTARVLVPVGAEEANHYLIYAINVTTGNTGLYLYDPAEDTWQRYDFAVVGEVSEPAESEPEESEEESEEESDLFAAASQGSVMDLVQKYWSWLVLGLNAVLLILVLALAIRLAVVSRKASRLNPEDEADEDDEDDEDDEQEYDDEDTEE